MKDQRRLVCVLNDGSFACMCWEGARGNNKIEVTVGKGDN